MEVNLQVHFYLQITRLKAPQTLSKPAEFKEVKGDVICVVTQQYRNKDQAYQSVVIPQQCGCVPPPPPVSF